MHLAITTAPGLESFVKNECSRMKIKVTKVEDRLVQVESTDDAMAKLNIGLRTANRVYLKLNEGKSTSFDDLFELVKSINWRSLVPKNAPIIVDALSIKSTLESIPAVQRTVKKAIIESLIFKKWEVIPEIESIPAVNIFVVIRENTALILLNTSGEALHKRGYRREAGDAPIKETLAAAIIMVSNWRYKSPFLDPFCGSGTIAIEAALLARNIAPGLKRSFAFEDWDWYDKKYKLDETAAAMARIYPSGEYQIDASDIDPDMVEMAMENARRAGIPNDVTFRSADVRSYSDSKRTGCLVTNPPYGLRLNDQDLVPLYDTLTKIFKSNKELAGGIITSWDLFLDRAKREGFEKRKLYNGSERCDFCYKKAA